MVQGGQAAGASGQRALGADVGGLGDPQCGGEEDILALVGQDAPEDITRISSFISGQSVIGWREESSTLVLHHSFISPTR